LAREQSNLVAVQSTTGTLASKIHAVELALNYKNAGSKNTD
jgi:hypothetical protein